MTTLIWSIIILVVAIVGLVLAIVNFARKNTGRGGIALAVAIALALLATILIVTAKVQKLEPEEVGIAYSADGTAINLKTGYNVVPIVSITNTWSAKAQIFKFSEGESTDDIFGAQTSEKDYITAVATISVRLDSEKLDTYIKMYGKEQVNSDTIKELLKTTARTAIENVISKYTTAEVMGNKAQINKESAEEFRTCMANQPLIIDSFTLDDLVAPDSYEQAITEQAELRQKTQTAELQKTLNETEAEANKVKAEGEKTVATVNAQKEAEVATLNAQKEADVATLNAQKEASVKKIEAENAVEVAKLEAEKAKTKAESDANVLTVAAEAEAKATTTKGNAEAEVAKALADVYKTNPEMYDLEIAKIDAEVAEAWAEKWSGIDLSGISPTVSWADVSTMLQNILNKVVDGE